MTWLDDRTIDLGCGQLVNPFWHCFGVKDERVSRGQALDMLRISRTALLPINCHLVYDGGEPLVGHNPRLTWERFRPYAHTQIPCLNVNLQTNPHRAALIALAAHQMTGVDLLKLEVLTDDLACSNDAAVVKATESLIAHGFRVMPLISASLTVAETLAALGVPVLRVMGSPIGSGRGIEDPDTVRAICDLGVPVILDGGIGGPRHALEAMSLGCAGFLVNSCLFADGADPVTSLRSLRAHLERHDPRLVGAGWDETRAPR